MSSPQSAVRNLTALTSGQAVSIAAGLVTHIWLARVLGPEGLGIIGFGTAVVAYLSLAVAFGTDLWGSRLIARKRRVGEVVSSRVFGFRLSAAAIVAAGFLCAVFLVPFDPYERHVLIVQACAVLAVPLTIDYYFQGLQRQTATAVKQAFQGVGIMVLTLLFVDAASDVLEAAAAQTVGVLTVIGGVLVFSARRYRLGKPDFRVRSFARTFRGGGSFAVLALVNTLFFTIDILMLGILTSKGETGLYVAGFRIFMMALVPSGLIFAVAFPRLASAAAGERLARLKVYATVLGLIAVTGCSIAIGAAESLIDVLYGEDYAPLAGIFAVQMTTVFFIHARMVPDAGLSSWGFQKSLARSTSIAGGVNVVLNFVLIGQMGALGAAVATCVAQLFLFAITSATMNGKLAINVLARQGLLLVLGVASTAAVFGLGHWLSGVPFLVAATLVGFAMTAAYVRLFNLLPAHDVRSILRTSAAS